MVAADQSRKRIEVPSGRSVGHEISEPTPRLDDAAAELAAKTGDDDLDCVRIAVITES